MTNPELPENPYLLLTPGPLSTTKTVKAAMLRDWCTWDDDYNRIVERIRGDLARLATGRPGYTAVLMQGSGTFAVEAAVGTAVAPDGKLLVLANGAYGQRIAQIARCLRIPLRVLEAPETRWPDLDEMARTLAADAAITTVAAVHCETTTGMLNPIEAIARVAAAHGKTLIVDAMSSFCGYAMDMADLPADYLISSANKCIQGVPGFGFVVARREALERCAGNARSLSLDLYDQWRAMEDGHGKWRFTSPTHVVRAFAQALDELAAEGGVTARTARYAENHRELVGGMRKLGFKTVLTDELQSHIITTFHSPTHPEYRFAEFYGRLKTQGFVIYPGKLSTIDCFRIGNIGDVHPRDIRALLKAIAASMYWEPAAGGTATP